MDRKTKCPLCNNEMILFERYPNKICDDCWYLTQTKDGKEITFANQGIHGGFLSCVDKTVGEDHQCFINGVECYAEEGRFGGIIISVLNDR